MPISFPTNPADSDTHVIGSITYQYNATDDKWTGLGISPSDRLIEGSNSLEINANNDLVWTGSDVGIGTNAPSSDGGTTLEIYNATTPTLKLNDGDEYKALLQLRGNDLEIRGSNGVMEFYTGNVDGASSTKRLSIDSNGRVLLGTTSLIDTSVASNFQIASDFGPRICIARNDTDTDDGNLIGALDFYGNHTATAGGYELVGRMLCEASENHTDASKATDFAFYTCTSGTDSATEKLRIDSSGRLLVGMDTAPVGTDAQYSKFAVRGNTINTNAAYLSLGNGKSTADTGNDDNLGIIVFNDDDPSDAGEYARIIGATDGANGTNDYPGKLTFYTTSNGESSPTKRLSISSSGATTMHVNSASHETFRFTTQASNEAKLIMKDAGSNEDIVLNTGGDSFFVGSGEFGIGTNTPASKLEVRKDSNDATFTDSNTPSGISGVKISNLSPTVGAFTTLCLSVSNGSATQNANIIAQSTSSGTSPDIHIATRSGESSITKLTITSGGEVTKPLQPGFIARWSGNEVIWNVATDGWTKITFDEENMDRGGNFSTTNSEFTVPVAGMYLFGAELQLEAPNGITSGYLTSGTQWMYIAFIVNGATSLDESKGGTRCDANFNAMYNSYTPTHLMQLAAGDKVCMYRTGNYSSIKFKGGGESVFWGYLVG